ncbi:MAG: RidA family protein [Burkholderiaceae bacterium]
MPVQYLKPDGLLSRSFSPVAVVSGGTTVYVSGQVGADSSGKVAGASMQAQTRQVFENLKTALAAAGADLSHVVKFTIFIVKLSPDKLADFRAVRDEYMNGHEPASTLVDTGALVSPDFLVEVEAIAIVD